MQVICQINSLFWPLSIQIIFIGIIIQLSRIYRDYGFESSDTTSYLRAEGYSSNMSGFGSIATMSDMSLPNEELGMSSSKRTNLITAVTIIKRSNMVRRQRSSSFDVSTVNRRNTNEMNTLAAICKLEVLD